jgi:haloacetate dehalogenase
MAELMNRRTMLKETGAFAVGALYERPGVRRPPLQSAEGTSPFFPGFKKFNVQTSGAMISGVIGGQGPPLLLLHGAPQMHITWRMVAPKLANEYTIIATDLRGYGDSSKPPDGENHANYSKRAMAQDQVEVMKHFGFDRFAVVGQDRGGRVTHRMALDHPEKLTKAAVLDIVPTYYLYTHVTIEFIQAYFHWFNNVRAAPVPENEMIANFAKRPEPTDPVRAEYFRTQSDPANIHGLCEDYRAGASIDLKHDEADIDKKIQCPLLVLWADPGAMARIYDVLSIWKQRGLNVTGKGMTGGHNMQEGNPDGVTAEIRTFLKS